MLEKSECLQATSPPAAGCSAKVRPYQFRKTKCCFSSLVLRTAAMEKRPLTYRILRAAFPFTWVLGPTVRLIKSARWLERNRKLSLCSKLQFTVTRCSCLVLAETSTLREATLPENRQP